MSEYKYPFDRMLVSVRKFQGLEQIDLESRSGVKRTYISRIETGDALPTPAQLAAIEAALGISFSDPKVQAAFLVLSGNNHNKEDSNGPNP